MKIKLNVPTKSLIGKRVILGKNFSMSSKFLNPKSDEARRRYWFTIRPNDKKKYRLYSHQGSPGCFHIQFEEVK